MGDEASKVDQLANAVKDLTDEDPALKDFCHTLTLQRYLDARKGSLEGATKQLRATLEWRRSFRPEKISFQDIKQLAATGRLEVLDVRDLEGRPILGYRLSRINVKGLPPEIHLKFMIYNLEAASKLADTNGLGKMTWLMDMGKYDSRQSVPLSTTREIMSILQNHYPERLGIILILNANVIFRTLYNMIKMFLDPVTRAKLIFLNLPSEKQLVSTLAKYIAPEDLEVALSCRQADTEFDVEAYQRRMIELAALPMPDGTALQNGKPWQNGTALHGGPAT